MKYYIHKSIPERLIQADEAITLGQENPELAEALAGQGYAAHVLKEGAGYVAAIKALDTQRRAQLGIQIVATRTLKEAYLVLRRDFTTDRRIVRSAIGKDHDYENLLRLTQNVERTQSGFILQARHFYTNLLKHTAVMASITGRYNLTAAIVESRLADIEALEAALARQQYLIGEMREVTKQRQDAIRKLDAWMSRFIASARIAFKNDPPGLKKLGIYVRSSKKKSQTQKPAENRS